MAKHIYIHARKLGKTRDKKDPYYILRNGVYEVVNSEEKVVKTFPQNEMGEAARWFTANYSSLKKSTKTGDCSCQKNNKDSNSSTVFFEGSEKEFEAKVKAAHPKATFSKGPRGIIARVGSETVGDVGEIKPGIFRGGYRKELREKSENH